MPIPEGFDWKAPDYGEVFLSRLAALERIEAEAKSDASFIDSLKAFYRDHPVEFINDWGMTADPRKAELGQPTDIPFLLFPKQAQAVEWVVDLWRNRRNGMLDKSRDMGASWIMVGIAVWMWLYHPGAVIGFGSRKEEYVDDSADMKAIFPKIRFFIDHLPPIFRPSGYDGKKHATYMQIVNPENSASIVGEAGDNIGRGARATIYFVDESAFLERPKLVEASLSQTTNCRIDLSTPNGESNPFAEKKFSGRVPCFTMHWRDHPAKTQAWYEEQKRKISDPVIIAQELDIDYQASSTNQFIKGDLVDAAMAADSSQFKPEGPLKLAVDVARFGNNKSSMALRQGRVLFWVKSVAKYDTEQVAEWVINECETMPRLPDQIAVDTIGVGAGVYDKLRRKYPDRAVAVIASERVEDGKFFNLRARMWHDAREWLQDAPVSMPKELKVKTQLTAPKYLYKDSRLLIESKDDMLKRGVQSPDEADAIVMTFAKTAHIIKEKTERRERNWRLA